MQKPKNKHSRRARISQRKLRELMRYFALDLDATAIAALSKLNRNTVNRYLLLLRWRIFELCERESWLKGVVEVDESYFGPRRVRGKRGRGAGLKTPVFGIFERGGTACAHRSDTFQRQPLPHPIQLEGGSSPCAGLIRR